MVVLAGCVKFRVEMDVFVPGEEFHLQLTATDRGDTWFFASLDDIIGNDGTEARDDLGLRPDLKLRTRLFKLFTRNLESRRTRFKDGTLEFRALTLLQYLMTSGLQVSLNLAVKR